MLSDSLAQFFSVPVAAWTSTTLIALFIWRMWNSSPAMFAQWVEYKKERQREKQAAWDRLQDENKRLDARCQSLEERVTDREIAERDCQERLANAEYRLSMLDGYQIGRGEAAQRVTILELSKKEKDDE